MTKFKFHLSILILFSLINPSAYGCITLPKNIGVSNSPFGISMVSMNETYVSFKTSDDRSIGITCDRPSGNNNWQLNCSRRTANGNEDVTPCNLSHVFPAAVNTRIQNGATQIIEIRSGTKKIQVQCSTEPENSHNTHRVEVTFHNGSNVIGTAAGYAPRMRARSANFGAPLAANIDFNSTTVGASVEALGCGGSSSRTPRTESVPRAAPNNGGSVDFGGSSGQ